MNGARAACASALSARTRSLPLSLVLCSDGSYSHVSPVLLISPGVMPSISDGRAPVASCSLMIPCTTGDRCSIVAARSSIDTGFRTVASVAVDSPRLSGLSDFSASTLSGPMSSRLTAYLKMVMTSLTCSFTHDLPMPPATSGSMPSR